MNNYKDNKKSDPSPEIVQVKVNTPSGERTITYKRATLDSEDENLCDTKCPYGKICEKLRNPLDPDNENSCFMVFCNELVFERRDINSNFYIPVEGTLEENLGDIIIKEGD